MPLAVVLQSALQNLVSAERVQIVVSGTEVREENQLRLSRIVDEAKIDATIQFVVPDVSDVSGLPTTNWHKLPVYLPILVDQVVPKDWTHVLLLDADMLVRGDLGELWARPLNGNVALGVPDFRNPTVYHRHSLRGIYDKDLGIDPSAAYCNAGMMLIDLRRWRKENMAQRCLAFLNTHSAVMEYKDQDAINGIIGGQWEVVEPEWNVALSAVPYFGYPVHESLEQRTAQSELVRNSQIVHFSGPSKPWHFLYRRRLSGEFFHHLLASRWFAPSVGRRWTRSRRFVHQALRRTPEGLLRNTKQVTDQIKNLLPGAS